MIKTITATDAVRTFSELLNSIKYKGESYIILRGGKPAATIGPAEKPAREKTLAELAAILKIMPRIEDDSAFASDVESIMEKQPPLPEKLPWE